MMFPLSVFSKNKSNFMLMGFPKGHEGLVEKTTKL